MSARRPVRQAAGAAAVVAAALAAGMAQAGPERVAFPEGYLERFVDYLDVDRPDRKIVRRMYVNPEALAAAVAGEDAPYGTVLVMEDRRAKLGADDAPLVDDDGRMRPTDEILNLFVMEKQPGFGETIAPELRNGDWDYAWYLPDGSPRPEARFEGCFTCHLNRPDRDFTFTFVKFVLDTR
jgi:hypothetical protein